MRNEPIELRMPYLASRSPRPCGSVQYRNLRIDFPRTAHTEPVDEAFAHFASDSSSRSLAAQITSQLEALDRQREQLVQLLRTIENFSSTNQGVQSIPS